MLRVLFVILAVNGVRSFDYNIVNPTIAECAKKCPAMKHDECAKGCQLADALTLEPESEIFKVSCKDACHDQFPESEACNTGCGLYEEVRKVPVVDEGMFPTGISGILNSMLNRFMPNEGTGRRHVVVTVTRGNTRGLPQWLSSFFDRPSPEMGEKMIELKDVDLHKPQHGQKSWMERFCDAVHAWASDPIKVFFCLTLVILAILLIIQVAIHCVHRRRARAYRYSQLPTYIEAMDIKVPLDDAEIIKPMKQPSEA